MSKWILACLLASGCAIDDGSGALELQPAGQWKFQAIPTTGNCATAPATRSFTRLLDKQNGWSGDGITQHVAANVKCLEESCSVAVTEPYSIAGTLIFFNYAYQLTLLDSGAINGTCAYMVNDMESNVSCTYNLSVAGSWAP